MIVTRRRVIGAGGAILAGFALAPVAGVAAGPIEVTMKGKAGGSAVWFDPVGLHIMPGQTIRWTNRDPGNSHTVTAYHPAIFSRPRRIPEQATPWNSDYLLPTETFSLTLTEAGVYDYYCVPHEHAGMVGRIVVGKPPAAEPAADAIDPALTPLPQAALDGLPSVEEIVARRFVRHR